ncbi:reverse transcriptase domain-containing protein [Paenibacillus taichungensis]|uniref:reverse transcriptase domain-containing protein n=1 Tax=Paenibacillus taichungensis TaxID=484184 RepID=UPI002DBE5B80|nr:reverse transcriptase domain-containing protein [Paenibacillus taichungensis]MEC0105366.1 reverse transcriptase domain-containing protein [Paenibacillus taichungensis]MEC0200441.1 reverse transcriptase domain-containing protein [Paenibacillus taichungensis]
MRLSETAIKWAIKHLQIEKDTDLFPSPKEIQAFFDSKDRIVDKLKNYDITKHKFNPSRRFVIPKAELTFRNATQLDPVDSLLLAAVIYEYGKLIEQRRIPIDKKSVFSYRFAPLKNGVFYSDENAWKNFWESCLEKSETKKYVVQMDISDFYNQISHDTVKNQLKESLVPEEINEFIMRLLGDLTNTVHRGIPIGPHSSHLLAEMTLIPIDESLILKGLDFCRYADDIYIFCNDEKEAQISVYHMVEILDKQQRLTLQNQKTNIYKVEEFRPLCEKMLNDDYLSENENQMIIVLKKYTGGLYQVADFKSLEPEEQELFSEENISGILDSYLNDDDPDFKKIRWIYRRLAQIGAPKGIEYTILNIQKLIPAISDVCHYLISASRNFEDDFILLGDQIVNILDDDLIKANQYFYVAILNLFASNSELNHLQKLLPLFKFSSSEVRRKLIFAAYEAKASTWIREQKEQFSSFDPWSRRALLVACSVLPDEEKQKYLTRLKDTHNLSLSEEFVLEWAMNKTSVESVELKKENVTSYRKNDLINDESVKVIFFGANPKNDTLRLDDEVRDIEDRIRKARYRDGLKLISKWSTRTHDLLQTLNENKPHIVHFSGHGSDDGELILLNENSMAKPVSVEGIASLFKVVSKYVKLVVFNNCFSAKMAEVVSQHVDAAIGMNDAIGDDAARVFASQLYSSLGFGLSLQEAFEQAVVSIQLEGIPNEKIPVLFCKDKISAETFYLVKSEEEFWVL